MTWAAGMKTTGISSVIILKWARYWANHLRERDREANVNIKVTEMWDAWDLTDPMHLRTFNRPDLYSFVDVSQNNLRRKSLAVI